MEIKKINYSIKCDIKGCGELATYLLGDEVNKVYLCDKCLKELYAMLGKEIIPKSPKNVLNKKINYKGE
jgi:hypothetical protein